MQLPVAAVQYTYRALVLCTAPAPAAEQQHCEQYCAGTMDRMQKDESTILGQSAYAASQPAGPASC